MFAFLNISPAASKTGKDDSWLIALLSSFENSPTDDVVHSSSEQQVSAYFSSMLY